MCVRGINLLSKYLKNICFVVVDGNWSDWSEPSECSVTCGGGVQTMERSCNNLIKLSTLDISMRV
jgi:hypothetical protein